MKENKLELEIRQDIANVISNKAKGVIRVSPNSVIAMTPNIGEDYWICRVKLGHGQAILGFPKFFTIGIGFAKENDWNTNLPYSCDTDEIFEHIKCNKKFKSISDEDCKKAITMISEFVKENKDKLKEMDIL